MKLLAKFVRFPIGWLFHLQLAFTPFFIIPTDGKVEVLIKWKNVTSFDSTWEHLDAIVEQFPDFHLEDKVVLVEGGYC